MVKVLDCYLMYSTVSNRPSKEFLKTPTHFHTIFCEIIVTINFSGVCAFSTSISTNPAAMAASSAVPHWTSSRGSSGRHLTFSCLLFKDIITFTIVKKSESPSEWTLNCFSRAYGSMVSASSTFLGALTTMVVSSQSLGCKPHDSSCHSFKESVNLLIIILQ